MNDEYDNMLFNYETTHRTDYRLREFQPLCKQKLKPPRTPSAAVRIASDALKDIHTLSHWKRDSVPFNLFINRNEIVWRNPAQIQTAFAEPEDLDRQQVQKTRPRLLMTPAVCIDDIESKEARELLISDIYLSESERALREVAGPALGANTKVSRDLQLPAPANPIRLPPLGPMYVCPEWRRRSALWDRRQLRARVDAHMEFFIRRKKQAE